MVLNTLGVKKQKGVKRVFNISWWKVGLGLPLAVVGIISGAQYLSNPQNMLFAMLTVFGLGPGALLVWWGFSHFASSFMFYTGKPQKATGRENAIILFAKRNNGKDVPLMITVAEITHPPKGARLHFVRNWKRHFYELFNNTATKKLEPVQMPDKKSFPPELYKIPAVMQPFKDYMDYNPPTMFQKLAPGILILAMIVVGILQVITLGG